MRGTVSWFSNAKGYGFIQWDGGPDVFVHHTSIVMSGYRSLNQGDVVDFEMGEGPTGKTQADRVVVVQKVRG